MLCLMSYIFLQLFLIQLEYTTALALTRREIVIDFSLVAKVFFEAGLIRAMYRHGLKFYHLSGMINFDDILVVNET